MTPGRAARTWHGATAVVAVFALLAELLIVLQADSVPADADPQSLAERVLHFLSYFTVLSNLLVAWTTYRAARDRDADGRLWRVLRLDAVVAITVTGLVHWFLLRPLVTLTGWGFVVDKLLHVVVPLLALVGWLVFGPRLRVTGRVVLLSLVFPILWLVGTLTVGAVSGWYPYPFVDVDEQGAGPVAVACLGVLVLIVALLLLAWLLDRRLTGPTRSADAPLARTGR